MDVLLGLDESPLDRRRALVGQLAANGDDANWGEVRRDAQFRPQTVEIVGADEARPSSTAASSTSITVHPVSIQSISAEPASQVTRSWQPDYVCDR